MRRNSFSLILPNTPIRPTSAITAPAEINKSAPRYILDAVNVKSESSIRCISVRKSRSMRNQIPIQAATQPLGL